MVTPTKKRVSGTYGGILRPDTPPGARTKRTKQKKPAEAQASQPRIRGGRVAA